jgi:predicted O-linked N-acetylglucosamine transferase (SPINDLY family)
MMRGRHAAAILDRMNVGETVARTVDEYVTVAGTLGRDAAKRNRLSAQIRDQKYRIYRDLDCIAALEAFLDEAVRRPG